MPRGLLHYFCCIFQAVWAQWPQKILWNSKRTLWKRQKEGDADPSCQASPILWIFWLLLPYGCFSEEQCFSHEWAPFMMKPQVISVSWEWTAILPGFWHFPSVAVNATPQISVSLSNPFLSFLGLLANLCFREFSQLVFVYCVFSPFKHHLSGAFICETLKLLPKSRILLISNHLRNNSSWIWPNSNSRDNIIENMDLSVPSFYLLNKWHAINHLQVLSNFYLCVSLSLSPFFFFWPPCGIWSSQARDQIQATQSLLIHCAWMGIEPASWCCWDMANPVAPQWERWCVSISLKLKSFDVCDMKSYLFTNNCLGR